MTSRTTNASDDSSRIAKEKRADDTYPRVVIDGCYLPRDYPRFAEDIENFEVFDDDVWLCGFPKTGTTWSQEMVWCVGNDVDLEAAKTFLADRFPFFEHSTLGDANERNQRGLPENTIRDAKNLPRPRYIKTHLQYHFLPRQIRTGEKKPRIIYVLRNPKDTCISFYHFVKVMAIYNGDFDDLCESFLTHKVTFGPFWDHALSFWKRRNEANIHFLKFEDMKADLPGMIRKTAAFLGKGNISDENMKRLVEHLSIDSMRKNPYVNHEEIIRRAQEYANTKVDGMFIRNGGVNQWKGKMSQDVIDRFDKITKEKWGHWDLGYCD